MEDGTDAVACDAGIEKTSHGREIGNATNADSEHHYGPMSSCEPILGGSMNVSWPTRMADHTPLTPSQKHLMLVYLC